jgi:hypothetical protein
MFALWIAELPRSGEIASTSLKAVRGNTPQLKSTRIFLSIENIGRGRIREYAGTISVPAATLTFNAGSHAAEVGALIPGYRSFRGNEGSQGGVAIFAGDNFQVVSIEVAVDHLSPEERAQMLEMDVVGEADADGEALRIRKPLKELMQVAN